ncbi:hypothetical protein B0H67DRAFT_200400 [Lasiosphaeris hirsuta]|uniref:Uncharacterized protein n=1 Tax=Lasiosphaeris hirsuta TaxID=260670 RepID=A0AA40E0R9_9PEZI|nr:hypothetical protein B0H67DRAFT_200400 [Lasiosphaeris hirsuta]
MAQGLGWENVGTVSPRPGSHFPIANPEEPAALVDSSRPNPEYEDAIPTPLISSPTGTLGRGFRRVTEPLPSADQVRSLELHLPRPHGTRHYYTWHRCFWHSRRPPKKKDQQHRHYLIHCPDCPIEIPEDMPGKLIQPGTGPLASVKGRYSFGSTGVPQSPYRFERFSHVGIGLYGRAIYHIAPLRYCLCKEQCDSFFRVAFCCETGIQILLSSDLVHRNVVVLFF